MIINVEFDTQTKELKVNIDGSPLDNVTDIQFYNFSDKGAVEIRQVEPLEEDKAYKLIKIIANENNEYEKTEEVDTSPLTQDIIKVLFRGQK